MQEITSVSVVSLLQAYNRTKSYSKLEIQVKLFNAYEKWLAEPATLLFYSITYVCMDMNDPYADDVQLASLMNS